MIEITNYISKILFKDTKNSYSILTYIDFNQEFDDLFINNYINQILTKNPILSQRFIEKDDSVFIENIPSFNKHNNYSIVYTNKDKFDDYIETIIIKKFSLDIKWICMFCIDKVNKKSRFYFKIHHSYVDGYKLIEILVSPVINNNNITTKFKRTSNTIYETLYYYIIGTIMLIIINIRFLFKIIFGVNQQHQPHETELSKSSSSSSLNVVTDYILCKNFNLDEIKMFTKKRDITVNDFLYSLMIKTDKLYRKQEKTLLISSPINVSGLTQQNNLCPIFNIISNSYDDITLLNKIHNTFNNLKYSLFIRGFSVLLNVICSHLSVNVLLPLYNKITSKFDYAFSNIIGPSLKNVCSIYDIHFLTTANDNEIIYNIISYENNVNLICSFNKDGPIKNKKRYKKCIYKAYKQLLKIK
jgi:hypothetical protein